MPEFNTDSIFRIHSKEDFNELALEIFHFQKENNPVYSQFVKQLNVKDSIKHYKEIPFLPIELFRSQDVLCGERSDNDNVFRSSSTTSQAPSKHIVKDVKLYEKSFVNGFSYFYGPPQDYCILALLPGYLERKDSSLVYMFHKLIELSGHAKSGFYLNNYEELKSTLGSLKASRQRTLLIGVSYALLDLAETGIELDKNFIVMETGGMKGKRKELLKEELHRILKVKLGVDQIQGEYGMTELLSQAYSEKDGIYQCPPWMKVLIRDVEDPLSYVKENRTGGVNVIDLANVNSCSFIATQDLGRMKNNNRFELMGRFDNSDIRGCNLMIG